MSGRTCKLNTERTQCCELTHTANHCTTCLYPGRRNFIYLFFVTPYSSIVQDCFCSWNGSVDSKMPLETECTKVVSNPWVENDLGWTVPLNTYWAKAKLHPSFWAELSVTPKPMQGQITSYHSALWENCVCLCLCLRACESVCVCERMSPWAWNLLMKYDKLWRILPEAKALKVTHPDESINICDISPKLIFVPQPLWAENTNKMHAENTQPSSPPPLPPSNPERVKLSPSF